MTTRSRGREIVDSADAVVLVTAEYNYGYPAALKNALDYLHHEWRHKPLGFVSYGGVAAGTRAVQQLKQVTGALQLIPTGTAVNIPFVFGMLEDGVLHANDVMEQAAARDARRARDAARGARPVAFQGLSVAMGRAATLLATCVASATAVVLLVTAVAPDRARAFGPARPARSATPPQNPFLAPNPFSNLHDDTWMSNVYPTIAGPTRGATTAYGAYSPSVCGSLLFDARGRIVSVCPGVATTQARIIDPTTLRVLATYDLPGGGATGFQSFTGGGYIYLDQHDHLWTTTRSRHLYELAIGAHGLRRIADYDLAKVLAPGDGITSALPDFEGDVWFVTKPGGIVGVIAHGTHRVRVSHADSEIENSFAVGVTASTSSPSVRCTATGSAAADGRW